MVIFSFNNCSKMVNIYLSKFILEKKTKKNINVINNIKYFFKLKNVIQWKIIVKEKLIDLFTFWKK